MATLVTLLLTRGARERKHTFGIVRDGGHSNVFLRLIIRIRKELGISFEVIEIIRDLWIHSEKISLGKKGSGRKLPGKEAYDTTSVTLDKSLSVAGPIRGMPKTTQLAGPPVAPPVIMRGFT